MFFEALSTIHSSQDMDITEMFIDGWTDKEDVVYLYMHTVNGILFSHENEGNLPFVTTKMELEGILLNVRQKKSNTSCYLIKSQNCGKRNRIVVSREEVWGKNRKSMTKEYKLSAIRWIR